MSKQCTMKQILNIVLATKQQISKRLDSIEDRLEIFETRITEIDNKYAELERNLGSHPQA